LVLEQFLRGLAQQDMPLLQSILAEDVRARSDGGEFPAARVPVVGRDKVLRLFFGVASHAPAGTTMTTRQLNGLPGLLVDTPGAPKGWAPRMAMQFGLDDEGRIRDIFTVLASRKLTALSFPGTPV
jgi:RNA polymerase sigma-70 factor, ECF subfamily